MHHAKWSTHPGFSQLGIRSFVAVPLIVEGKVWGTLSVADSNAIGTSQQVISLLRPFAVLVELHIEAEHQTQHRERFLAVAVHDLRTPVAVASMVATALADQPDVIVQGLTRRLKRSTDRMRSLLDDAADLVRGRFGVAMLLNRTSVDATQLLRGLVQELGGAHPQGPFRLDVPAGVYARWDRTRMEQALCNLLSNALQHRFSDTLVDVSLRVDRLHTTIEVRNCGDPIDARLLPVLFDPFRRGPHNKTEGLGLGLYIVQRIVAAHGGDVTVRSDSRCTRFIARLPNDPVARGCTPT